MTMLEPTPVSHHPVVWFAERAHQVLDEVLAGGVHVALLPPQRTADTVVALGRLADRIAALQASLLPHADTVDVAAEVTPAATTTGAWLARATRTPGGPARRRVMIAQRLETTYTSTRDAALAGQVNAAQVEVVVAALDALPRWVSAEQRLRAEDHLVELASRHDAKQLRILAKHLLHVIDPDAADAELARRLEAEEAAAARTTHLKLFDDGNGTCHGSFRIPSVHGAMLAVALDALASPKRPDPIPREEAVDSDADVIAEARTRTAPEVLGEAFCQLLERFPAKKLPKAGGGLVTVLVTLELQHLLDGLGNATMSTGAHLSAGQVRRLACSAGIIPAVLGSKSQLLDLGRKVRLHTEPQRIAMALRDRHCTVEGCEVPAAWCHAHHIVPWSRGGGTTVKDGRLVCPRHHRMIHHPRYTTDYRPDGTTSISRIRQ